MKIFKYLLVGLLLVILAVVSFAGWLLFTQSGRDFLVAEINGYTTQLETPVVLGKLEGNVFGDVRLASLSVADAEGVWLDIAGVRLVWRPLALLDGTRPFDVLEVATIAVARLPVAPIEPAAGVEDVPKEPMGNPLEYLVYVPKELRLADVIVEAPVTGMRHRLRADIASAGVVQDVAISTLEGPATTVSGTVALNAVDDVAVDLGMTEAPRGLVGGLLKMPVHTSLAVRLVGGIRQQDVSVTIADIRAGQSRVVAQGRGTIHGEDLQATLQVVSRDLSELQGLAGAPVRGALSGAVDVRGSLAKLGVNVVVSETSVAMNDVRVAGLAGQVSGTLNAVDAGLPFDVSGVVNGTLSGVGEGNYPLRMVVLASGTEAAFGVSSSGVMERKGERADVRVGAAVVVSPMVVNGTIDGGWVKGKTRFTLQGRAAVDPVRAVLNELRLQGPGTVVSASGVVDMQSYAADGRAVVKIADLGALAGMAGVSLKGSVDADVLAKNVDGVQRADATVRTFMVDYAPYKAVLKQPARLVWDGTTGSLSPFILETMGGLVTARGSMSEVRVDGSLMVRGVDVTKLIGTDAVEGVLNLAGTVTGRPEAPVVIVDGTMDGKTGAYPITVTAKGDWRAGKLVVKAVGKSGTVESSADVVLGGTLSLIPFEVGITPESSLSGKVIADMDLKTLNPLLWTSRQKLEGRVNGQATLGGTLGEPLVNGRFVLANGSYDQTTSGLCLRNLGAEIVASRDVVEVRNLKSSDKDGGTLVGRASLGLQDAMPLKADIALTDLQLFCGGLATGKVGGKVGVQGVLADHTETGDLLVGPLAIQVPGASNDADIPHVEVVRVKADDAKAGTDIITRLAVTIDAPQQVYVRGRGLDAEFGGKLAVSGLATDPKLHGTLTALRGRFTLLDRVLQLADTSVRFEGPMPPSPYLNVKATTTAQGTTINLTVTGAVAKPQLALTSDPSLPQDEVLALLLFGRKLSNISPFEALKLAQATRVLAGLDGGEPTILDKARQTLGVDTLDIGTGEEAGDVTVTTGKYLTDSVYLSVQQGVEPQDRQFKTEIELAPNINGNTTVDGEGNQSFGLEWKRDY